MFVGDTDGFRKRVSGEVREKFKSSPRHTVNVSSPRPSAAAAPPSS